MVPEKGLEPPRCYPPDFESGASAIPPLRHVMCSVVFSNSLAQERLYHNMPFRQEFFITFLQIIEIAILSRLFA